jgi:tRNA-2-methylthio-N6-dimethylallyladenosine synthase
MGLVREVSYASAFSFKYSPRPGTPAATAEQVPEAEKAERLARLQALLGAQQAAFQAACIGRSLPVLIEKPGRHSGQMVGRSPYLQAVHLDCDAGLVGQIVDVTINGTGTNSLSGVLETG